MIAIPLAEKRANTFTLFLVLEPENLERMRENDPAEFNMYKLTPPWDTMKLRDIILVTPTPEDLAKALALMKSDDVKEALRLLTRGYRFRPDKGDGGEYLAFSKPS